jgi:uncharacterized protein DUF4440
MICFSKRFPGRGASLRRTAGFLLILACAGSVSVRAQEGGENSARAAVLAREQAWSDAESRNDNGKLDGIFDNALVYIEEGRVATKGECLSMVRLAGAHSRQIGTTKVNVFGSTAIVVGTYRETSVKDGKPRQWRFIDTWVNKNGSWMLVAAGASPLSK